MLSEGFVAALNSQRATDLKAQFPSPVLQVFDIQSFNLEPNTPSRYYVALSDGMELCWGVVPPKSSMELSIDSFEVEPGSVVAIPKYGVLTALNQRPLLLLGAIQQRQSFVVSAIGQPKYEKRHFPVSHLSLAQIDHQRSNAGPPLEVMSLKSVWENQTSLAHKPWGVDVVVLWVSKLRRSGIANGFAGPGNNNNPTQQAGSATFLFDCRVMDKEGTAVPLLGTGKASSHKRFMEAREKGRVVRLSNISLRYELDADSDEPPAPQGLLVTDRSVIAELDADEQSTAAEYPTAPVTELVPCTDLSLPSLERIRSLSVGEVVSVQALVARKHQLQSTITGHGNVSRLTLTLRDVRNPAILMDITLWGTLADDHVDVIRTGEKWIFRNVVLGQYRSTVVLATRSSSEVFLAPSEVLAIQRTNPAPPATPASAPSPSMGIDGTASKEPRQEPVPKPTVITSFSNCHAQSPPCLARIADIEEQNIVFRACTRCGRRMEDVCPQCSSQSYELRLRLLLTLSDGESVVQCLGFSVVAEVLFGVNSEVFVANVVRDPTYAKRAIDSVIGNAVLVRLSRGEKETHLLECQNVDPAACGIQLLNTIHHFTADSGQGAQK